MTSIAISKTVSATGTSKSGCTRRRRGARSRCTSLIAIVIMSQNTRSRLARQDEPGGGRPPTPSRSGRRRRARDASRSAPSRATPAGSSAATAPSSLKNCDSRAHRALAHGRRPRQVGRAAGARHPRHLPLRHERRLGARALHAVRRPPAGAHRPRGAAGRRQGADRKGVSAPRAPLAGRSMRRAAGARHRWSARRRSGCRRADRRERSRCYLCTAAPERERRAVALLLRRARHLR